MAFSDEWKQWSILVTGAFGILGLLKDFKKDGKVTRWGYVSLVGIILSATLGFVAQVEETTSNAKKAVELGEKANKTLSGIQEITQKSDKSLQEVQQIAEKSDLSLHDIKRSLSPLEDPELTAMFRIPCDDPVYQSYCQNLRTNIANNPNNAPAWDQWPFEKAAFIRLGIYIYLDGKKADRLLSGGPWERPDLSMFLFASPSDNGRPGLNVFPNQNGEIELLARNKAVIQLNRGTIKSTMDLPGATAVLFPSDLCPPKVIIDSFQINTKSNEMIGMAGPFTTATYQGMPAYRFVFPEQHD